MLFAQSAKESMFGDIEKLLEEAKAKGAELLAPSLYSKAVENFNKANDDYIKNASTRDIREKLTKARDYCNQAIEAVNLAKISLKDPIEARDAAVSVEASEYAKEQFKEAEELFKEATKNIEDGDIEDAKKYGSKAEELYRASELKAIKDKILIDARKLIRDAKSKKADEFAPKTYKLANNLLAEVEELLNTNRYAGDEASLKAAECIYQAKHSIYLTEKIKSLRESGQDWESLILEFEKAISGIAGVFGESPHFDAGWEEPLNVIITRISNLKDEHQELIAENAQLQEEYDQIKERATSSSEKLAKINQKEAKISKVKSMFSPTEAKVLYDGEHLVIRLHGLTFPPGKAIIQPEYFSILTKVQNALAEYNDKQVLIEGHTDSRGAPSVNMRLSEERANAVREYLLANMDIKRSQLTAVGYGDRKPITSNNTEEGRRANRRIDVVISLSK